ncbi:ribonuclease III [Paenibacillus oenotherae]|uniref:Mini-ribonuclease 3 n=1 Tax=Paenibacillus oenotherae TaxID=1435645 RepID=A0ABS7DCG0_9BACL|nr:ribonuclease III [Paenibacillus oenotherae]
MERPASSIAADRDLWSHDPVKPPHLLNPIVLAYIGDAVFELLIRQYLISQPNHKLQHLHRQATGFVSAKAQCSLLERWKPLLTEAEADIVRRGRNAKSGSLPKNADPADYRQATALECLVGYLYYSKQIERLHELMAIAFGARADEHERAISEEGKE